MKKAALLFLFASICCAQTPQVPVTGSLGAGGNFNLINSPALVFTSDANHTMSYPESSGSSGVLVVTSSVSLTATRNMVAPLMKGFQWLVKNQTTGGQSIQIVGATGSGVTIANGSSALVYCDGTNYLSPPAMVYPGAGVPNSNGASWGTSYTVGTGANNLVQLNSSAALPAVNGANLTSLNGANLQSSSVANAALANSSMTVNGTPCVLGGSCTPSGGSGFPTVVNSYTSGTTETANFVQNFPSEPPGIYRVSVYLSLTGVTGSGSSTITAAANFTDYVGASTFVLTAVTQSAPFSGNTPLTPGSFDIYSDGSAMSVTISTSSTGSAACSYLVQAITLERLQ